MARRNTRTSRSRARSRRSSIASIPWMWLITGVFIGLFVTGLMYLKEQNATKQPHHAAKHTKSKIKHKKAQATKEHTSRFEFYTLLPNMQVNVQHSEQAQAKVSKKAATYILQIGSFRKQLDADRLKAELTLKGFDVEVKRVETKNGTWNRVRIGPYPTIVMAEKVQSKLRTNRIDSLIRVVN